MVKSGAIEMQDPGESHLLDQAPVTPSNCEYPQSAVHVELRLLFSLLLAIEKPGPGLSWSVETPIAPCHDSTNKHPTSES